MQKTEKKYVCAYSGGCITVLITSNRKMGLCFSHQGSAPAKPRESKKAKKEDARLRFRMGINPASKPPIKNPSPEDLIAIVADAYTVDPKEITEKRLGSSDRWPRKLLVYMADADSADILQILTILDMSPETLRANVRSVKDYIQKNQGMTETIENIRARYVL